MSKRWKLVVVPLLSAAGWLGGATYLALHHRPGLALMAALVASLNAGAVAVVLGCGEREDGDSWPS